MKQSEWDKIFKKDGKNVPGVLRRCDNCGKSKYCWKIEGEYWCGYCIDLENSFQVQPVND